MGTYDVCFNKLNLYGTQNHQTEYSYDESYHKTRSVCGFVWVPTPPLFMDRSVPNVAGRSGMGTEKNSRDPFPWQPSCSHDNRKTTVFMARSGLVGYKIACDATIHDVTWPMTSYVTSPWQ